MKIQTRLRQKQTTTIDFVKIYNQNCSQMSRNPIQAAQIKREELKMRYVNNNSILLANDVLKYDINKNIPQYSFNNIPPKRKYSFISKTKYCSSQFTSIKLKINNQRMDSILSELSITQELEFTQENQFQRDELFDFNSSTEDILLKEISQSTSEELKQAVFNNKQFSKFVKSLKQPTPLQQRIKLRKILKQ